MVGTNVSRASVPTFWKGLLTPQAVKYICILKLYSCAHLHHHGCCIAYARWVLYHHITFIGPNCETICSTHHGFPGLPAATHWFPHYQTDVISLWWLEQPSRYSDLHSGPELHVLPSSATSAFEFRRLGKGSPLSSGTDSHHLSYTANELPLPYLPTNSISTMYFNMSFLYYTVASISSYKSHKNVSYPRRVHLPLLVTSLELGHISISPNFCFHPFLNLFMNMYAPWSHEFDSFVQSRWSTWRAVFACRRRVSPIIWAPRGFFASYW